MTQSFDRASLICTLVVDSVRVRVLRYSAFTVRLLFRVTSTPSRGENDSLILTVGTLHPSIEAPLVPLV